MSYSNDKIIDKKIEEKVINEKMINVKISDTTAKVNQKINVCLEISEDIGFINEANIFINMQNSENEKNIKFLYLWTKNRINYFTCNIELEHVGLYYYGINIIINGISKWLKFDYETQMVSVSDERTQDWTMTIYDKDFSVPTWAKGKVMYHIFVDRFYKSEKYNPTQIDYRITKKWGEMPSWNTEKNSRYNNIDFFMGNLKGIEEKIPYIKSLGVKIIYLSPIFESQSNHRYDVGNYERVDSYLGTNEDLKKLCTKAHKNGMKIILDGVFNHTGNDSLYFNEYENYDTIGAYQGIKSKYYDWYKHNENGEFEYWWGFKNLPVCNPNNKDWQNYIYGKNGIIDELFNLGIDGIRLDVADELTDNFIENIRIAVKRNKKDGFIIGEVWENAITKEKDGKQRKYLLGKGMDTVMNYPFTNAILKYVRFGDYQYFKNTLNDILAKYPKDVINSLMNSLSTHDITRAITTLVGKGIEKENDLIWDTKYDRKWQTENEKLTEEEYIEGIEKLKIATIIQYFLPGNSCIYYGDEIGMYGYRDPFNRKCFDWKCEGNDLNKFFVKIGKIKNKYDFLSEAQLEIICLNEEIISFKRFLGKNSITIVVNRNNENTSIEFLKNNLEGKIILQEKFSQYSLDGLGFIIIENKNKQK